jgi:hypothetical protein
MDLSMIASAYADRSYVGCPRADWKDLHRYALSRDAAYWVTNDWQLTKLRPQLAFLLSNPPPDLKLVFSYRGTRFHTFVYRILGSAETAGVQNNGRSPSRR